jgi:hypothetical protein
MDFIIKGDYPISEWDNLETIRITNGGGHHAVGRTLPRG